MIIHHMSDGSIRNSIEGVVIPSRFENVYRLANNKRRDLKIHGNISKSGNIREKQILDR